VNGGRELANEIIKKNEKDTHDAREEAKRAEEATERERRIGICWGLVLKCYELRTRQHRMLKVDALRPSKHDLP
jgi:hypothetical protein